MSAFSEWRTLLAIRTGRTGMARVLDLVSEHELGLDAMKKRVFTPNLASVQGPHYFLNDNVTGQYEAPLERLIAQGLGHLFGQGFNLHEVLQPFRWGHYNRKTVGW